MAANAQQPNNYMASVRAASEKKLGIIHFVSAVDHGWHGDIRKRFTDFLVNEVRKDGVVLTLDDYSLGEKPTDQEFHIPGQRNPNTPASNSASQLQGQTASVDMPAIQISDEDQEKLRALIGGATTSSLLELFDRIVKSGNLRPGPGNSVVFPPMQRELRGTVHQEIRRIFSSRIETETDGAGIITAVPSARRGNYNSRGSRQGQRSSQPSFKTLGGDYLHFTLYKENKDTMDAVNQIARMLKIKSTNFGFAGTKDRRAATVQRCSVFRVQTRSLDFLNRQIPAIKMGNYHYRKHPMQLGDHGGNQFVITVKNCHLRRGHGCSLDRRLQMMNQCVGIAMDSAAKNGFVNYFGLQRFGTHTIGTHELGMLILKGDFEKAINALLHVDAHVMEEAFAASEKQLETANNRDELNRARAIAQWHASQNADAALKHMPKRFSAEASIIRHLDKSHRDFQNALLTITRGMRMMYIHAFQSYVWNFVASRRWAKYGNKVVAGDLVLVESNTVVDTDNMDDVKVPDESFYQQARPLNAEEAASGNYSIFDIILPTPGFDIVYPKNDIGDYYVEFMKRPENGGLDPYNMRRSQKEFSLSGSYRKLIARFTGQPKWEVRTYIDDNEQMHPTDLNKIQKRMEDEENQKMEAAKAHEQAHKTDAAGWNNFAANAAVFDDQLAAERRRQRNSSPEVEPRINDVWVQTASHGSSKRMKVAEHKQSKPQVSDSAQSSPVKYPFSNPSSGGAPLFPQIEDNENQQQRTKALREPKGPTQNTTGFNKSVSQEDPIASVLSSSPAISGWPMSQTSAIDQADHKMTNTDDKSPPHSWNGQAKSASQLQSSGFGGPRDSPSSFGGKGPGFDRARSGSPMVLDDQSHSKRNNGNGHHTEDRNSPQTVWDFKQRDLSGEREENIKIAVVLTFRLNSSNYATIALRELMGQVVPDALGAPGV